jgi:hypothetical protein
MGCDEIRVIKDSKNTNVINSILRNDVLESESLQSLHILYTSNDCWAPELDLNRWETIINQKDIKMNSKNIVLDFIPRLRHDFGLSIHDTELIVDRILYAVNKNKSETNNFEQNYNTNNENYKNKEKSLSLVFRFISSLIVMISIKKLIINR